MCTKNVCRKKLNSKILLDVCRKLSDKHYKRRMRRKRRRRKRSKRRRRKSRRNRMKRR